MRAKRASGRRSDELRKIKITRRYTAFAPGSVLIEMGRTKVLCTAMVEPEQPRWLQEQGQQQGWITAEYAMLPSATPERKRRSGSRPDNRAAEIQRMIGRVLRSVVELEKLGCNTIWIDCDVLQADGGTRTAAVTGGYVALVDALRDAQRNGLIADWPVREAVAAVSVGIVDGRVLVDLDYSEDCIAEVDMNVAMTDGGRFAEIQAAAEAVPFTNQQLQKMLELAGRACRKLHRIQAEILKAKR